MGSVTATVIPGEGYVRVEANWQDFPHARRVWIYRTVNGVDTKLRDGDLAWLSDGIAVAFDHEAPLDTPFSYKSVVALNYNGDFETGVAEWQDTTLNGTTATVTRSTDYYVPGTGNASMKIAPLVATARAASELIPVSPDYINANPYFETDASDWSGFNGAAVSRDTTNFHQGVASLLIVPNGVSSGPGVQTSEYAAVPGRQYGFAAWLRISSGGSASRDVGLAFYDSSHAQIGSATVVTLSPAATVWASYSGTAVAPTNAAYVRMISTGPGVLAAANTWRLDQAMIVDTVTQVRYTGASQMLLPDFYSGLIMGVQLDWYNDGVFLATSGGWSPDLPFPGVWTPYSQQLVTAAPGANSVKISMGSANNALGGVPVYADEVYLTVSTGTATTATVTVPSNGGGWWTDPLHPATKVRLQIDLETRSDCAPPAGVAYLGVGEETFPADGVALEVNDAVYPVAAFQRRKSGRQEMRVGTATLTDLAAVKSLHASGAPLLLQINSAYGEADAYQLHGDLLVPRINGDQRVPWRLASSNFTKVAPPVGPAEGTLKTRYVDLNRYPTFWRAQSANGGVWDDYNRIVAPGGAGSASSGQAYTVDGTGSWVSVNGYLALAPATLNTRVGVRLGTVSLTDLALRVVSLLVPAPSGNYVRTEIVFRWVDANNYLALQIHRQTSGAIDLQLIQTIGGVLTSPGAISSSVANVPGQSLNVAIRAVGTAVGVKIWRDGTNEPPAFELNATVAWTTAGNVGLAALLPPGNTNTLPLQQILDTLLVTNLAAGGGATWLDALRGSLAA